LKGHTVNENLACLLVGSAIVLLVFGVVVPDASAQTPVTACGTLAGKTSYRLEKDLVVFSGTCLTIIGNGLKLDLNGHSIRGHPGATAGIVSTGNNITIKGPGIVRDFDGPCISLYKAPERGAMRPVSVGGRNCLVENVTAYNCGTFGIRLGGDSRCVGCRIHDTGHLLTPSDIGPDEAGSKR
jgi:hypothetical protein